MELYPRLPYDAQGIIMRLTPHPLAVLMVESPMFRGRTAFAGAAILGDGRVGLILDVHALVKLKSAAGDAA